MNWFPAEKEEEQTGQAYLGADAQKEKRRKA